MKSKSFQYAVALMWLGLPLTAYRYWSVWDRLPARMASHFDANWHANGWMPRDTSFQFAIGLTVFMLVVFTIIAVVMRKSNTAGVAAWAMLVFSISSPASSISSTAKSSTTTSPGSPSTRTWL